MHTSTMHYNIPPILNHQRRITLRESASVVALGTIILLIVVLVGSQPVTPSSSVSNSQEQVGPTPQGSNATQPTPEPTAQVISLPSQILDLANWKLTLPLSSGGNDPLEITQPELGSFTHPEYFKINSAKNGVIFGVRAGGATTSNSGYPRSELREMSRGGVTRASWSSTSGYHVMEITQAVMALPKVKPEIVAGQIHDEDDDVIMIRLEGRRLFVEADGQDLGLLDGNYQLGTTFTIKVESTNGHIITYYNNKRKVDYRYAGGGLYFKAGAYLQSNPDKGDAANAYGEVVIYKLVVEHR